MPGRTKGAALAAAATASEALLRGGRVKKELRQAEPAGARFEKITLTKQMRWTPELQQTKTGQREQGSLQPWEGRRSRRWKVRSQGRSSTQLH